MADKAFGQVVFEGEEGTEIPKGTRLLREDGAEFVTTEVAAIGDSREATVNVAAARAGAKSECAPGTVLELKAGIEGVSTEAMVSVGGLAVTAEPATPKASAPAASKPQDDDDTSAPPKVKLTLMLNGGTLVSVEADVLDAHSRPSGEVLYDLRATLPDGRVVRPERVRAKPEDDVAVPPYYEEIEAPLAAAPAS